MKTSPKFLCVPSSNTESAYCGGKAAFRRRGLSEKSISLLDGWAWRSGPASCGPSVTVEVQEKFQLPAQTCNHSSRFSCLSSFCL